jgi:hypothetical protein
MNLRGGWELIKRSYLGWLAGRGFYWTLTLSLHFLVEAPQAANNSYNESGWMPDWNCA